MLAIDQMQPSLELEYEHLTITKNQDYLEIEEMYEKVKENFAKHIYVKDLITTLHEKRKEGMILYWKI